MTRSPYTEAGRIAAKIRKSEQRRDCELAGAEADHVSRCRGYLDGASAEARHILEKSEDKLIPMLAEAKPVASEAAETAEAPLRMRDVPGLGTLPVLDGVRASDLLAEHEADRAGNDLSTIAPSLREPVPPLNAIVKERR